MLFLEHFFNLLKNYSIFFSFPCNSIGAWRENKLYGIRYLSIHNNRNEKKNKFNQKCEIVFLRERKQAEEDESNSIFPTESWRVTRTKKKSFSHSYCGSKLIYKTRGKQFCKYSSKIFPIPPALAKSPQKRGVIALCEWNFRYQFNGNEWAPQSLNYL